MPGPMSAHKGDGHQHRCLQTYNYMGDSSCCRTDLGEVLLFAGPGSSMTLLLGQCPSTDLADSSLTCLRFFFSALWLVVRRA